MTWKIYIFIFTCVFLWRFMGVFRLFHGCFKGTSQLFQECFNVILEYVTGVRGVLRAFPFEFAWVAAMASVCKVNLFF